MNNVPFYLPNSVFELSTANSLDGRGVNKLNGLTRSEVFKAEAK